MKKINKKSIFLSIFLFAIAWIAAYVFIFVDNNVRYLVSCAIATIFGGTHIFLSKSTIAITNGDIDERDTINIEKSSRQTLQIMNYILAGFVFIGLTLYVLTKNEIFLIVAITELATIILLLVLLLASQFYYEKNN